MSFKVPMVYQSSVAESYFRQEAEGERRMAAYFNLLRERIEAIGGQVTPFVHWDCYDISVPAGREAEAQRIIRQAWEEATR